MSTVLITGGCGFLGSHLARFLLQRDYNVILVDVEVNERLLKDIQSKLVVVRADVTDRMQLQDLLKKYRVNVLVHYAALLSGVAELSPELGYKVNFDGVWNLYNAARVAEVESVVFASSVAAYGSGIFHAARENVPGVPETLYGISKQLGEMLGLWFHRKYGIQFVAFRFASVVGPGRRDGGASAYSTLMIQKPAQGEPYEVSVGKDDSIPITYVKDVAEVTTVACENIRRLKTRIYNVASLNPSPTAAALAQSVRMHIPSAELIFNPNPITTDIVRSWPKNLDTSLVQDELGWRPRYDDLETLVGDFIRQVNENPEMFYV